VTGAACLNSKALYLVAWPGRLLARSYHSASSPILVSFQRSPPESALTDDELPIGPQGQFRRDPAMTSATLTRRFLWSAGAV
jgi:hypothetical protein